MAVHSITDTDPTTYNFEFWRGDPPNLPSEQIVSHTRPGADGVAQQKLGSVGPPITAQLVSHWSTYAAALAIIDNYFALVGKGLVIVVYNNVNWNTDYSVKFWVNRIRFLSCQAHPLLMGTDYAYSNGAELVTEWTLTPKDVS